MATGLPVAQLMATIGLNTAPLAAGMAESKAIIGGGTLAMGAAVAGVGLAAAAVTVIATKMAGDFQTGMTSIVTGAGESQKNLQLISDGVLKLATQTGTSTSQLTAGLYMIESGGYHGQKALDILKAAAMGAKVGMADLGVVADATDTILKNYPDVVNGANGAVNTLIATVAHGKTHMQDLSDALAQILPTASSAGIGLNDVMAGMATMTAEGVPAAEAATYLRQTIIALSAPGSAAKKMLESIGLTSTQVANEMQKSLPGAIALITDHLKNKYPIGSAAYIAASRDIMGGMRQMQGFLDLGGKHVQMFTDNVKNIAGPVSSSGKTIAGWSLVQGTFNQKMSQAGAAIQVMMIQLGEKLLPVATAFMGWLGSTAIPAIENFAGWLSNGIGAAVKAVIAQWKEWTAVGGPLHGLLVMLPVVLAKIHQYFELLGQVWQAQILPALQQMLPILKILGIVIGVVLVASITAIVVGILILVGVITGVIFIVTKLVQGIIWAAQQIPLAWQLVTTNFHNFLTFMGQLKDGVLQKLAQIRDFILSIPGFLASLPGKLLALGEQMMQKLGQGIRNAAGNVTSALKNIPGIGGMIGQLTTVIPHFATGGVMAKDGPALVGERGPELVQLPGGARITPLPAGLSSGGGFLNGQPLVVNLHIDGKRVAQATVPHLHTTIRNATGVRNF